MSAAPAPSRAEQAVIDRFGIFAEEESIDLTPGVVWTDDQLAVLRRLAAKAHAAERVVRFEFAEEPEEIRVERVAWAIEREFVRRCETCLRPEATDEDWASYKEGMGEHLCWEGGDCRIDVGISRTRLAAVAAIAALDPT